MSGDGKILVSRVEAAERLSMSLRSFERYAQPHLALVRQGRMRLVSVRELERWAERNSARTLEVEG
jgi:hypothetical protein